MKRRTWIGLAVIGAVALAAVPSSAQLVPPPQAVKPEQVGMSADRLARISQVFAHEVEQNRLPGAVIMVARKGQLVFAEAIGNQDKPAGKSMAMDSIFRIYSMTKPLVSVAAMIVVEDGRMQLTDPVSRFLPAMRGQQVSVAQADSTFARIVYSLVPAAREMTVQDLLRHSAGLAYGEITANLPVRSAYGASGLHLPSVRDFDVRDMTPAEQIERLAKAPLAHQPGTIWEYGLASDLLGRVVEAATGQRLGDFLAERVFKPLKMDDTGFWLPPEKTDRLAEPFATDPASGAPNRLIDVSAQPRNDSGGAGAVSTAGDYLRFAQMLLNGGQLDGQRILSRTTVALMTADHLGTRIAAPNSPGELLLGTPGYGFGLGFAVRLAPGIAGVPGSQGEFMWAGYAGTFFWVDPKEELVGIYMTQAPSPIRAYYRKMIKQLVHQAIVD